MHIIKRLGTWQPCRIARFVTQAAVLRRHPSQYGSNTPQQRGIGRTPGVERTAFQARSRNAADRTAMETRLRGQLKELILYGYQAYCPATSFNRAEETAEFVSHFNELARNWGTMTMKYLKPSVVKQLLDEHSGVNEDDIHLALYALNQERDLLWQEVAYHLLQCMSTQDIASFTVAWIHTKTTEHVQSGTPHLLQGEMIAHRQRLQAIIEHRAHDNPLALQLEAQLLEAEGKYIEAIRMYDRMMDHVLQFNRQPKSNGSPDGLIWQIKWTMTTPWNDIFRAATKMIQQKGSILSPYVHEMLAKAVEVGVEQDDAQSHFNAARMKQHAYFREQHESIGRPAAEIRKSSMWLYHMTKAACSDIPEAAAELGKFYATQPWPYLDNEPPWYIKPTPFDKFPSKAGDVNGTARERAWYASKHIGQAMGLVERAPTHEDMFFNAALPSTTELRLRLAFDWLEVAAISRYAPALRDMIELRSTATISQDLGCPEDALQLKDSRYAYSSASAYTEAMTQGPVDISSDSTVVEGMVNPLYDEDSAKKLVKTAKLALRARQIWLDSISKTNKSSMAHRPSMVALRFLKTIDKDPFKQDLAQWINSRSVLDSWVHDDRVCDDFNSYLTTLCKQKGWNL